MNTIDLTTCIPGQKVRTREGTIGTYVTKISRWAYPHRILLDGGHSFFYRDDGYLLIGDCGSDLDIVEILPMGYGVKHTLGEMVTQLDMMKQKIVDMLAGI